VGYSAVFGRLLLLLIVVPFVEVTLLVWLAARTSFWFTMGLVICTGVTGVWLARRQGWQTWNHIQREMAAGRLPGDALVDGLMILVAGFLLMTPGMLTDAVGFLLLLPSGRRLLRLGFVAWFMSRLEVQSQSTDRAKWHGPNHGDEIIGKRVIDVSSTPTDEEPK